MKARNHFIFYPRKCVMTRASAIALMLTVLIPCFATALQISSVKALSPWDDSGNGVPNYLNKPEFMVGVIPEGNITLFGHSGFEVRGYYVNSSGIGDYRSALTSLGIQDVNLYNETVFSVVEEKIPFTNAEWIDFLTAHHLLNPGAYLPSVLEAMNWINCSDGRIRALVTFQFRRYNSTDFKIQTGEYFFNESTASAYAAPGDTINFLDIGPTFTIGDPDKPKPSKTTKAGAAALTILEWIENAIDLIKGKKGLVDILEKLGGKAITKATQWVIKFLAGLIGGVAGRSAVELIKMILEGKGICVIVDAIKKLLDKLGIGLPWWFPDPVTSEGNPDLHLYDLNGTHLLGMDYSTNTTLSEFSHGIYSGDTYYIETMFISRSWLSAERLKVLVNNSGDALSDYGLTIEDPLVDRVLIGPGKLGPSETVNTTLYLDDDGNITCNQVYMQANFSTLHQYHGRNVTVDILLSDENGTTIQDAREVSIVITNGSQFLQTFYATFNSSTQLYRCVIATSAWPGSYYMSVYPLKDDYLSDNKYCTFFEHGPIGDFNGDGTVDIYDAIILANAFGSTPTSARWNPIVDLKADNVIDIYDAIILSNHFNQHYP